MKVLTRRNAMLGWATWRAAKGIAKYHKAKGKIPDTPVTRKKKTSKKKRAGQLAGIAAAVGGMALLKSKRKHKSHAHDSTPSSPE
jgi:hypothetical protein